MASRKYTKEILEPIVAESVSWSQVLRSLHLQNAGGNSSNIQRAVKEFGIDFSHFTGQAHNKGKSSPKKKHWSEYLVLRPEGSRKLSTAILRRSMIEAGFIYKCCFHDCPTHNGWINGPISFEIDHINGNNIDNRIENLRFICAICHTQQPTSSHSWKNTAKKIDGAMFCPCGRKKSKSSYSRCSVCYKESRRGTGQYVRTPKIEWPSNDKLLGLLRESNYTAVGKMLGVSDNAIRHRMRVRGLAL